MEYNIKQAEKETSSVPKLYC